VNITRAAHIVMDVLTREERHYKTEERTLLFRPEASSRRAPQLYGDIVLMRPVSLTVLLWLQLAIFVSAAGLLVSGHYTSKAHATGILLPDRGILKIFPPQSGTLVECHVRNGQRVHKGDLLFLLSSDRSTPAVRSIGAEVRRQFLARQQSLLDECAASKSLSAQQAADLRDRIEKLEKQQTALTSEIRIAEAQFKLDEETIGRYRELENAKLISVLDLREKERIPLQQQKTIEELRRSQIALQQERKDLYSQLARLPLQLQVQNASLERAIYELDGQLNEQEASHQAVVRSPADGTLSAVLEHVGMRVEANTTLAALVPSGARLEAHLYAPGSAIGFIKPGKTVLLRYRAYPSEQASRQIADLSDISQVALSPADYAARTGFTAEEPMYEMIAKLPAQTLTVFGRPRALWLGMELEADILLERRNLIDELLEPILTAKGKLTR
jgi:membrane fusion protein